MAAAGSYTVRGDMEGMAKSNDLLPDEALLRTNQYDLQVAWSSGPNGTGLSFPGFPPLSPSAISHLAANEMR